MEDWMPIHRDWLLRIGHAERVDRLRLTTLAGNFGKHSLMKAPLKYGLIPAALIAIAVVYGQQPTDVDLRISRLQQTFEQLTRSPRSMEQVSPAQDKLLEKIVDEVIFLHRENSALRKEIESLKARR